MRPLCILIAFVFLLPSASASAQALISEVYYCHGPVDDGFEWVELYNGGLADFSLDGYTLAHGGLDYTWSTVTFGPDDVIPACGTFVVGGPFSVPENAFPVLDKVFNFNEDLQNGGIVADAVAIFAPGADILVDTPIDAVLYGDANSTGLLDETGAAGPPDVGNVTGYGQSIVRTSVAGGWVVGSSPDPNLATVVSVICEPIPTETPSWGHWKSRFGN